MVNKGRKNVAYTMLDVTGNVDAGLTAQLSGIDALVVEPLLDVVARRNGVVRKGSHVSSSQ